MSAIDRLEADLAAVLAGYPPSDAETRYVQAAWSALAADGEHLTRWGRPAHFTASAIPLTPDGEGLSGAPRQARAMGPAGRALRCR